LLGLVCLIAISASDAIETVTVCGEGREPGHSFGLLLKSAQVGDGWVGRSSHGEFTLEGVTGGAWLNSPYDKT
jgi:hypothetical protein